MWGIFWLWARRSASELPRWGLVFARWLGVVAVVQALSLPIGSWVGDRDMKAAKAYCESLLPALEAYHDEHDCYPTEVTLAELIVDREPYLLRNRQYYHGQCSGFSFQILDPGAILGSWWLDGESRQWRYAD